MRTDKPNFERKTEENCQKPSHNDFSNQKAKAHDFKKKEKSFSHEEPFKIQKGKFQNQDK